MPIGNKVLLATPAYSGFYGMARAARVDTVDSPMLYRDGRYEIDWDDLESRMTADVRAMIVCNPQNPTGNVWTEEELLRLGRLALEHKVVVLADEIHSDVIRAGHSYTPFASLPDEAVVNNSVTFNAISKTFNLAAMKNAYYYFQEPHPACARESVPPRGAQHARRRGQHRGRTGTAPSGSTRPTRTSMTTTRSSSASSSSTCPTWAIHATKARS